MKTPRSFRTHGLICLLFGGFVLGCGEAASETPTTIASTAVQRIDAGEQARARFGIEQYVVGLNPDANGKNVSVALVGAGGASLGELVTYRGPNGEAVVRIMVDGTVTELRSGEETLTVERDGVVRYALDRAQALAPEAIEGAPEAMPSDLVPVLGLAATVVSDDALRAHVATVDSGEVPYLVRDCPWWVTLAACVGWETGVGAVMCVACGASYLL